MQDLETDTGRETRLGPMTRRARFRGVPSHTWVVALACGHLGLGAVACGGRSTSASAPVAACSAVAMDAALDASVEVATGPCAPPASLLQFVALALHPGAEHGMDRQQSLAESIAQHVGFLKYCKGDLFDELALARYEERAVIVERSCGVTADGASVEGLIARASAKGWAIAVGTDWPEPLRDRVSAWILAVRPR